MITFHVGTRGLATSIEFVCSDSEWMELIEADEIPPNCAWQHIAVADEAAQDAWLRAMRDYLCAAWTPNQSGPERDENAEIIRAARDRMAELEEADAL